MKDWWKIVADDPDCKLAGLIEHGSGLWYGDESKSRPGGCHHMEPLTEEEYTVMQLDGLKNHLLIEHARRSQRA